MLLGQWPSQKPNDPETYIAGVVAVLAEYPAEVVAIVTDPRRGLATRCKFLPTIAELTEALEGEMRPHRMAWQQEREKRIALPRYEPPKRTDAEKARIQELTKNLFRDPGASL